MCILRAKFQAFLPPHRLGDAVIPRAVVDSGFHVIHPGWIRICLAAFAKDWGIQKHVGDVVHLVILDLNLILFALFMYEGQKTPGDRNSGKNEKREGLTMMTGYMAGALWSTGYSIPPTQGTTHIKS